MSHRLYRLGSFAARRPWVVIASWVAVALVVVGAASAFGRDLEDSMEVPGLDSQQALELLASAESASAGLTAQVVATPRGDDVTFADSKVTAALTDLQAGLGALPQVVAAAEPVISPDGRVALIGVQYPVQEELSVVDLENLKTFVEDARDGSPLVIEMGGDLFFSFEEAPTGTGELIGVIAAGVILLISFGSVIAAGLPIGLALFGLALGDHLDGVGHLSDRHPQLRPPDRHHDRAWRGDRLRALRPHPTP